MIRFFFWVSLWRSVFQNFKKKIIFEKNVEPILDDRQKKGEDDDVRVSSTL